MKINIVAAMTNNFGKKGMYNSQEIGLARGLSEHDHTVKVIKCVVSEEEVGIETINDRATIEYKMCKYFGSNGDFKTDWLDGDVDLVIQFADLQMTVPRIYRWCVRNKKKYIPYVGVTFSQAHNSLIRKLMDILFERNVNVYKKTGCIAKSENVKGALASRGISKICVAPVCLDIGQINTSVQVATKDELRAKWGFGEERVILFIGRFEEDKHPLDAIRILDRLNDKSTKLLMVGQGNLHHQSEALVAERSLTDRVRFIEKIDNSNIWELYRLSDVLINLNPVEIWGMTLLEAMYYKTGVIAHKAPGPSTMILNGETGFIAGSFEEIGDLLETHKMFSDEMLAKAYDRVINEFSWKKSAGMFLEF